ncbi:alpha-ketoglutarate-dependent dioxygenase AlkB [Dictyobacter alpinus]|uniref:Alpha-ketoglutarate-dependent dioxygenase AlkB n=1 Tax=Dictyobacter alpinus TaxID=2014873 RepID=A0A402BKI5_9CHLR|nr:alpha-ketoglutarate-dependent dioxygenase AlkB [Dictyobacter alpinus]GCE31849.1 alpha-ketoglutarate-dependent dioxygenase AlkB [Dictyobacter alpinus]
MTISMIAGLTYHEAYLAEKEQAALISLIDQQSWITDLKRRVQHYGYRYDYTRHTATSPQLYLGSLPEWLATVAQRLHADGFVAQVPDQVIVNEYEPGQGISSHIDCVPCFDDTILSLSLLSPCVMQFTHTSSTQKVPVLLEPGSLLIMQGEARYAWKHGLPARKTDVYQGQVLARKRRISLTFRNILAH